MVEKSFVHLVVAHFSGKVVVDGSTVVIHLVGFAGLGVVALVGEGFTNRESEFKRNHSVVSWIINRNFDSIIYVSLRC